MKTLKFSLFLLFLITTLLSSQSCKPSSSVTKGAIQIPDRLESALLWELTGKGLKKPSYIFGTIHMISAKDFELSDAAIERLNKSKRLVMEIDMSQMMATSMKMLALAPMKGGKKLKDIISEEDYQLVKTYFTQESSSPEVKALPFTMIENWKPMLLQSFLYQDMIEGPVKAYEMELLNLAQSNSMTFGGLETVEDQINVFEKIPYKDQAAELVKAIKEIKVGKESGATEFAELVKMYKSQDIDGMVEQSSKQFEAMDNSEEELLTNRNTKWIPKIVEMAKKEQVFFAVGAAHLGGPNGVIRLLMKEGYTLKPIR